MAQPVPQDDRYQELLAARVIEGLSPAEQEELEQFSSQYPDFEGEEIERVGRLDPFAGGRREPNHGFAERRDAAHVCGDLRRSPGLPL